MSKNDRLSLISYSLMIALGIALIFTGFLNQGTLFFGIASCVGGAFLATGLSLILSFIVRPDIDEFRNIIFGDTYFMSQKDASITCKGNWYFYHTSKKNDVRIWQQYFVNLKTLPVSNNLKASIKTLDQNNNKANYYLEVVISEDKMIVIGKPVVGAEMPFAIIIYGASIEHLKVKCGIGFHPTWDGDKAISSYLICRQPLIKTKLGKSLANKDFVELDKVWGVESKRQSISNLSETPL